MRKPNLERNKIIYDLYFIDKLKISDISKEVNLSISQISRVLSKSPLYQQEKANRKEENRIKHNEQTKQIMKIKRNNKRLEEKAILDIQHYQAAIELSGFYSISNVAIRKNCLSAYTYNIEEKQYELKNDMVYSSDMPKLIKY